MYLGELKSKISLYAHRLEEDPDYEMSDEMQDEYHAIKEELEMAENEPNLTSEYRVLKTEFDRLCREYENPDDVINDTLSDMYPETDGEFDLDEWD